MVEISLYFHFPYCTKKCPYCHFYVTPPQDKGPFLQALLREWERRLPQIEGKKVVSIYFGGGTPTLFIKGVEAILQRISAPEITVETNPENVTPELIKRLRDFGVNRISIGVQSLDNSLLKHLGRGHTALQAIDAVTTTKNNGIENITIDLMYELPHQTLEVWRETVERAAALPITHLSLYNLTIEPHTAFKKKEKAILPHLPDEQTATEMLTSASAHFEKKGLLRYEISAFARNHTVSVHNTGYWTGRPFLGYGPSAFSFWDNRRFQNVCHLRKYIKALQNDVLPVSFEEELSPLRSLHEKLAIGLRLRAGMRAAHLPLSTQSLLFQLAEEGWITYKNDSIALTDKGTLFYDTVAEKIIL